MRVPIMALAFAGVVSVLAIHSDSTSHKPPPSYEVTDLGAKIRPQSINSGGDIVGFYSKSGLSQAFVCKNGTMHIIDIPPNVNSIACSINASSQIVGLFASQAGGNRPFLFRDGKAQEIGDFKAHSNARGINRYGAVVGFFETGKRQHAYLYENGKVTDLGTLGGMNSYAESINDKMQIVGYAEDVEGKRHAFLWENGEMHDLDTPHGKQSQATYINNAGVVIGFTFTDWQTERACLWQGGKIHELGTLGGDESYASGINDAGQVVGRSEHAFLWQEGKMYDLNRLIPKSVHWELYEVAAINDRGQIVGYGTHNGQPGRAFLLTPVEGRRH